MKRTLIMALMLGLTAGMLTFAPAISADNNDKGHISVNTTANTEVSPENISRSGFCECGISVFVDVNL